MPSTVPSTSAPPEWEDLPLTQALDVNQLDNIKAHLDLVLLALEALAGIGSDAILTAANKRNVTCYSRW